MSDGMDWAASAMLLARDDSGSDRDIDFRTLATGPLASLVAQVVAMPPIERARVLIDRGPIGTITAGEILALAQRDDFPGA